MSLLTATLIPGIMLILLGVPLLLGSPGTIATLRSFPRSQSCTYVLFGAGAVWFLYLVAHLSEADFGDYKVLLLVAFALIAVLSFKSVPDFLAVRGLSILILLGCYPLLMSGYLRFEHPQIWWAKNLVLYVAISLALWLGAQPWRMRDFLEWLFARRERTRTVGGLIAGCGLALSVLAFT